MVIRNPMSDVGSIYRYSLVSLVLGHHVTYLEPYGLFSFLFLLASVSFLPSLPQRPTEEG